MPSSIKIKTLNKTKPYIPEINNSELELKNSDLKKFIDEDENLIEHDEEEDVNQNLSSYKKEFNVRKLGSFVKKIDYFFKIVDLYSKIGPTDNSTLIRDLDIKRDYFFILRFKNINTDYLCKFRKNDFKSNCYGSVYRRQFKIYAYRYFDKDYNCENWQKTKWSLIRPAYLKNLFDYALEARPGEDVYSFEDVRSEAIFLKNNITDFDNPTILHNYCIDSKLFPCVKDNLLSNIFFFEDARRKGEDLIQYLNNSKLLEN